MQYPVCIEPLSHLLCNEGQHSKLQYFTNEVAMNFDLLERQRLIDGEILAQEPTVDFAFGISEENTKRHPRLVLVEVKLNVENANNIKRNVINDKFIHSIDLLNPIANTPIYDYKYIVVTKRIQLEMKKKQCFTHNDKVKIVTVRDLYLEFWQ
ncbi:MAG: hypothetical protein LBO69_05770 [Ignavibacteria bacterium]|jgi:hypothetical protein|nr:hypothetical protein [Ignavibacteria bacterium]